MLNKIKYYTIKTSKFIYNSSFARFNSKIHNTHSSNSNPTTNSDISELNTILNNFTNGKTYKEVMSELETNLKKLITLIEYNANTDNAISSQFIMININVFYVKLWLIKHAIQKNPTLYVSIYILMRIQRISKSLINTIINHKVTKLNIKQFSYIFDVLLYYFKN